MTNGPDRERRVHRSHKAPESIRNLLKRLGFRGPKNPLGDLEQRENHPDESPNE